MWSNIRIWLQGHYNKIINSIAFYPAFIALLFLILSCLVIAFDFSEEGKEIKSQLHWLSLKDASTARSIISAIVAGVISLAVFSFSMVMIVLNQAASQMSNRVLDKLIGNRFQQVVLGIYIGTIVYALFLLSTIRGIDSGIYIPALSTYLLIAITVFDIFLFIYFLHYITQSVKYKVIIQRIYEETKAALERSCQLQQEPSEATSLQGDQFIFATSSGIYEGYNKRSLIKLCDENDCILQILHTSGTFVLEGLPVLQVSKQIPDEVKEAILNTIYLHNNESVEGNFFYGFRQLMEVAIKALSPGINDPGTAIESLRALFQLFSYRACYFPANTIKNKENKARIITKELTFEMIFADSVLPIWDYGKNDRLVQHELQQLLTQLQSIAPHAIIGKLLQETQKSIKHNNAL
ncbi:DUF2254 domain-containing protein [Pontibacter silvestris]|uniref:DUF2254 domain-containing protein n=1 Tax=Pontibacter silvestris TaxID=2305183 RepID=A0ABW4WVG7_9BACT|nr:DUF2254 domain-containing protein [Pontibacter silvestris]MCC9137017.1 DUF2254 domain-containing protein [Pontibacter silvestris]